MKTIKNRRRQHRTDYKKRIGLLKSGRPRIVFRKTNRYFIVQYVTSKEAKDKIEFGINSKDLLKYGWPESAKGSLKSLTASYFIGLLMGKQIKNKGLKEPIVDLGMIQAINKSKPYAFIKGLNDAGLKISCKEDAFPNEDRLRGEHLKNKIKFNEIKLRILK